MNIVDDLDKIRQPLKNPVLTIGNFDGVHRGHRALFDKVKERARVVQGQSAVMTFEPHPIKVMKPGNGPPLITPIDQKLQLIWSSGIDVIFCLPFDRKFAAVSARDFVETILVDKIGIRELVVGYDYTFGHNRQGNINMLKQLGKRFDFKLHVMGPVEIEGKPVSSTSIRKLVQSGELEEANLLLGRNFQISGVVVRGKDRGGKLLGFPTANLRVSEDLIPKGGVYAVTVLVDQEELHGVTNIGYNPTFGDEVMSIETHILDFEGNLRGKTMKINFLHRLRDEKTFKSIEELVDQIREDIQKARALFRLREKV